MKAYEIVRIPIDSQRYADCVLRPEAGAVVLFTGHVREWTGGVRTLYLAYESYVPMAEKMLEQIGVEIEAKWPGTRAAIAHRIGELQIGEIAVVIATSSPHRKDAYEANEYAIERIKELVPVWKKEIWENGTQWIGDQRRKPDNASEIGR